MKFYRFYSASMVLSFILTLGALVTLLPMIGVLRINLIPPVSTLVLLGLACINCLIRADLKRKQFGN